MSLLNYLVDAYETFAASAMAATSMCRSLAAAVLPFATQPMYDALGIAWGSSLLGFLSLAMCAIPFCFISWGERIRASSRFCQFLAQKKVDDARKTERQERARRKAERGEKNVEHQVDVGAEDIRNKRFLEPKDEEVGRNVATGLANGSVATAS